MTRLPTHARTHTHLELPARLYLSFSMLVTFVISPHPNDISHHIPYSPLPLPLLQIRHTRQRKPLFLPLPTDRSPAACKMECMYVLNAEAGVGGTGGEGAGYVDGVGEVVVGAWDCCGGGRGGVEGWLLLGTG